MHCALATFTLAEIESILVSEGIEKGTDQFREEVTRRFCPDEMGNGSWVERDDWKPEIKTRQIFTTEQVEKILRMEGLEPGTCDFWNAKMNRFHQTGAGSGEWVPAGEPRPRRFDVA